MPKMHSDTKLKELLESNGVPLNNAVKRGEFYRSYFDWNFLAEKYKEGNSIKDISKITRIILVKEASLEELLRINTLPKM